MLKNYAIILASGFSKRFGEEIPKQFLKLEDKTILEKSLDAFENNPNISHIILVCNPDYIELAKSILSDKYKKLINIIAGGKTRQESSSIGVSCVKDVNANVLIHDCARPFVSQRIIDECIEKLAAYDAVGVAIPSNDTIIKLDKDGFIEEIPLRKNLKRIQTPQAFRLNIIKKAHELAMNDTNLVVTDDCGLILHFNLAKIFVIDGDEANIKITYKSDLKN